MSNKTRNILKITAIILVVITLLMQFHLIVIPAIVGYKYWIAVVAFGLLLIASK
ncbi:MAG TPA: hypothetical protein VIN08_00530 [Ohtaekwangia sp.]|uniref:hypothetical protein n=1 Tax=Ohtaekwangia sp. TaxID=2066019 RepID=UPI002F925644